MIALKRKTIHFSNLDFGYKTFLYFSECNWWPLRWTLHEYQYLTSKSSNKLEINDCYEYQKENLSFCIFLFRKSPLIFTFFIVWFYILFDLWLENTFYRHFLNKSRIQIIQKPDLLWLLTSIIYLKGTNENSFWTKKISFSFMLTKNYK